MIDPDTNVEKTHKDMWKPHFHFITLHYLYIILLGILGLIILYPYGNLSSTQAYFFGVSASTESGLNVVDVNDLPLYQQLALFFIPALGNMQLISIMLLIIRFLWFQKVLKAKVDRMAERSTSRWRRFNTSRRSDINSDSHIHVPATIRHNTDSALRPSSMTNDRLELVQVASAPTVAHNKSTDHNTSGATGINRVTESSNASVKSPVLEPRTPQITFAVPERRTQSPVDPSPSSDEEEPQMKRDQIGILPPLSQTISNEGYEASIRLRRNMNHHRASSSRPSLNKVLSNAFVLGDTDPVRGRGYLPGQRSSSQLRSNVMQSRSTSRHRKPSKTERLRLSANAIIGHNSNFSNLSDDDKNRLGGIEYRALKLLIKIVLCYYLGLQIVGSVGLLIWILVVPDPKYRDYLDRCGINKVWWAIYSSGTMSNNLGFTLTPDSMISFRDAVWPILLMTILAYAGHTFYPVLLRLVIWLISKCYAKDHKIQEPIRFLLEHPRRCYTLLFPSQTTWILAGVLIALNFVDVLLIICLDLENPEVTSVPIAARFIASIFQAASARHTGTSTFNLANVNPGVQFSLLVMMYVSIFPIALSVRASNTYEESSLGIYEFPESELTADDGKTYLKAHVRNQLSFDLWWIFLSCFIICCIEADRIMDATDPAFQVFPLFFEVASAYGNVGLSLGHPSVSTSLSGILHPASQLILCATMIRGRHRGLPVRLDRAVMLPGDRFSDEEGLLSTGENEQASMRLPRLKKFYTE